MCLRSISSIFSSVRIIVLNLHVRLIKIPTFHNALLVLYATWVAIVAVSLGDENL